MVMRTNAGADRSGGFTLIELLVIVVVLGVLASVVVFAISNQPNNAIRTGCRTDVRMIEEAQEARRATTGSFAPSVGALVGPVLRAAPGGAHYVVSTDATGAVYVAAPPAAAPVAAHAAPNPCDAAA